MQQASLFSCIREGKRVEGGIIQEKSLSIPPFFSILPFLEKRIKNNFPRTIAKRVVEYSFVVFFMLTRLKISLNHGVLCRTRNNVKIEWSYTKGRAKKASPSLLRNDPDRRSTQPFLTNRKLSQNRLLFSFQSQRVHQSTCQLFLLTRQR